jgi:hypothetical protein
MAKARAKAQPSKPARKDVKMADVSMGNGGELHQVAGGDAETLTTQQGIPVADDQNSLRQGQRGPTLLEDFHFREKIFHFDHERIPERVVHARGYAAHGFFELTQPLAWRCHPRRHFSAQGRTHARLCALFHRRGQQGFRRSGARCARLCRHCKFIGHGDAAQPFFEAAGMAEKMDEGFVALHAQKDATRFITACGALRFWDREANTDADL